MMNRTGPFLDPEPAGERPARGASCPECELLSECLTELCGDRLLGSFRLDDSGAILEAAVNGAPALAWPNGGPIEGELFASLLGGSGSEEFEQRFAELRSRGELRWETEVCRPQGEPLPVTIRGRTAGHGNGDACVARLVVVARESGPTMSRDQIADLLDDLADIVYEADAGGNVIYANRASEQVAGCPVDELVGRPFLPLFSEESKPVARDVYRRTLQGESPEYELTFANGRACQFRNRPRRDHDGRITGVFGIARDVTDRKRAERERAAAFREKAKIVESMADGFIMFGMDGVVLDVNPAYERMTGRRKSEVMGAHGLDVAAQTVRADDLERIREAFGQAVSGQAIPPSRAVLVRPDGHETPVYFTTSFLEDESGRPVSIVCVIKDISDLRQAEAALRENERFLQSVFDGIQDGISILDPELNIIRANRWIDRLHAGKTPIEGRKCYEVYRRRKTPCSWCPALQTMESGEHHGAVVPDPSGQDEQRWMDVSTYPLKNKNGDVIAVIEHVKDITERKKAEEAVEKHQEHLEEEVEARSAELKAKNKQLEEEIADRKRAEWAMRASEEKYRSLVENSPDIIMIVNREGRIEFINRTVPGFTVEDTIGTSVYDYILPEYHDKVRRLSKRVLETGQPESYEAVVKGGEGSDIWYHTRLAPIYREDRIEGLTFVATDTTARRQAEERTAESERKYRTLFEDSLEAISITKAGKLVDANPAWLRLHGFADRKEVVGMDVVHVIHPDDQHVLTARRAGKARDRERTHRLRDVRTDGTAIDVELYSNSILLGGDEAILTTVRDISGRMRAERALAQSETNFRALAENAHDAILICEGETGSHVFANKQLGRLTGYSVSELLGMSMRDLAHSDDLGAFERRRQACLEGDTAPERYEATLVRKDGGNVLVEVADTQTTWRGKPALLGILRDITERKRMEEALRDSEEKHRLLYESALVALVTTSVEDGRVLAVNDEGVRLFGYSSKEECIREFAADEHYVSEDWGEFLEDLMHKGEVHEREGEFTRKDGSRIWVDFYAKVFPEKGWIESAAMDITERKKAEEKLRESERRYRAIVEDQTEFVCRSLPDTTLTFVNEAYARYYGLTQEELIGRRFVTLIPPEERERIEAYFASFDAGHPVNTHVHRSTTAAGGARWQQWTNRAILDGRGRVIEFQSVGRDITERKRAEEALRDSELKYRTLVEQIPAVTYTASLDDMSTTLYVSPQIEDLLGFAPQDYALDPGTWLKRLHPEDRERVLAEVSRSHATGAPFVSEYRMVTRDGRVVWVRDEAVIICDKDRPLFLQGVMTDITDRKRAEASLQQEKRFSERLVNSLPGIFYLVGTHGKLVRWNENMAKVTGYSHEELGQISDYLCFHPEEDRRSVAQKTREVLKSGEAEFEMRVLTKAGAKVPYLATGVRVEIDGEPYLICTAIDISDLKRAEAELRESEEKYRVLVEGAREPISQIDEQGVFLFMNGVGAAGLGVQPDEIVGRSMWEFFPKETADMQMAQVRRVFEAGEPLIGEIESIVGGEKRHYQTSLQPLIGLDGGVDSVVVIGIDKTDVVRAEEQYELLVEESPNLILRLNEEGAVVFANKMALQYIGMERNRIVGRDLRDLLPAKVAESHLSTLRQALEGNVVATDLAEWGERSYVTSLVPLPHFGVGPRELMIIATDVTERETARKQVAELSQRIIDTQENLLSHISRELHDEVGQLLTAIDIELETVRKTQGSGRGAVTEGLQRIKKLTHSSTAAVQSLCRSLRSPVIDEVGLMTAMRSHIQDFENRTGIPVDFSCSLKSSGISAEAGVGFFRIMQEALTNVARHANATHVGVALCRGNGRTLLEISDDGDGFNPEEKPPHLSGGLQGMRERVLLFGGELVIESEVGWGTRIQVSSPPVSGEEEVPL